MRTQGGAGATAMGRPPMEMLAPAPPPGNLGYCVHMMLLALQPRALVYGLFTPNKLRLEFVSTTLEVVGISEGFQFLFRKIRPPTAIPAIKKG